MLVLIYFVLRTCLNGAYYMDECTDQVDLFIGKGEMKEEKENALKVQV